MTISAIGTSVIYGTLLAAEGKKGKEKPEKQEKPEKPASAKDCAVLDAQKHPVQAQTCFGRVLQADPNYADDQLKSMTALSPAERKEVDGLCRAVLNEYFGQNIIGDFRASYFYLPKADGVGMSSMDMGKRLANPLQFYTVVPATLPSLASDTARRRAEVTAGLKKQLPLVEAVTADGKAFRIVRAFVRIDPGQLVTDSGTFDAVTVVPDRISVFKTK